MVDRCLSPFIRYRTWLINIIYLKWGVIIKELGEYLKNIRHENGVGIEEASEDLNISVNVLKNIESGNTRAFRDMLELREIVKSYAKYLGLDPDNVIDEFNDFLFEHTSKINLQDILEAEKSASDKNKKEITSPYTSVKTIKIDKKNIKYLYFVLLLILFVLLTFFILKSILIVDKSVSTELLSLYKLKEVF